MVEKGRRLAIAACGAPEQVLEQDFVALLLHLRTAWRCFSAFARASASAVLRCHSTCVTNARNSSRETRLSSSVSGLACQRKIQHPRRPLARLPGIAAVRPAATHREESAGRCAVSGRRGNPCGSSRPCRTRFPPGSSPAPAHRQRLIIAPDRPGSPPPSSPTLPPASRRLQSLHHPTLLLAVLFLTAEAQNEPPDHQEEPTKKSDAPPHCSEQI